MDRITLAQNLAKVAGDVLLRWYHKENMVITKGEKDFALSADIEAEKSILSGIHTHFPTDTVLSEEAGVTSGVSTFRWIVDPLDGTANFKAKIPYFCSSIAIEKNGEVVIAVVYDPLRKNLYVAEKGHSAYLNGERIHVSVENIVSQYLISYSTSKHKSQEVISQGSSMFKNALKHCRAVRLQGSSVLDLCYLASGSFDGLLKVGANYWDYAAGCLIAEEAGGKVTSIDGKPWGPTTENIIGSNNRQHSALVSALLGDS